uniref:Uncharacterized protein n=1 Tax=viral metagenome TaxID=1070528 RepID=A0A6M3JBT8_9ZZZZ
MEGIDRMDEIMSQLQEHLKPVIDFGAKGNVHHYNRAWEKIDAWFSKHARQIVHSPIDEDKLHQVCIDAAREFIKDQGNIRHASYIVEEDLPGSEDDGLMVKVTIGWVPALEADGDSMK